jgi:hypothetical protein
MDCIFDAGDDMIEVLKQMVEALENSVDLVIKDAYNAEQLYANVPTRQARVGGLKLLADEHQKAIQAGRQAIAELESQEPFCYVYKENGEDFFAPKDGYYPADAKPLYTHPPQRTWVGLTDYEIGVCSTEAAMNSSGMVGGAVTFARAIEAKLKQKNGYTEEKNT